MLAAADAIVRVEKDGLNRKRVAAIALCAFAMPLTHYLAGAVVAALFAYALIRLRGRERRIVATAFVVAGVVYLAAWGPFFYEQSRRFGIEHSWQKEKPEGHVVLTLRRLALLPLRYFTEPMKKSMGVGQLAIVMYVLPLILLWKRRDLLLWVLLAPAAIVPTLVSDLWRPASALSLIRYTFLASVPMYALAAAMLSHLRGFARHAVPLVLAISCALALDEPYSNPKADSRDLAEFVRTHVTADDILVIATDPHEQWLAGSMYLGLSHYGAPKSPILFLDKAPEPALLARIRASQKVWLMSTGLGVPNAALFPGSETKNEMLFPWLGTIARVEM
jgi:hypothetical protein